MSLEIHQSLSVDQKMYKGGVSMKYVCDVCAWVYDEAAGSPDDGIAPGTKWADMPEGFRCPLCLVGKGRFSEEN